MSLQELKNKNGFAVYAEKTFCERKEPSRTLTRWAHQGVFPWVAHLRECEGSKFLHKKEIGINIKVHY